MFLLLNHNHRITNNYGPTRYVRCAHCQHAGYCSLFEFRTWFAVCSLPLFLRDSRYYLLCEVCANGERLYGDEVMEAKQQNVSMSRTLTPRRDAETLDFSEVRATGFVHEDHLGTSAVL